MILRCIMLPMAAWSLIATPAVADECDETAAKVSSSVSGLSFVRRSETKPSETSEVHFKHPFGGTVEILCTNRTRPVVTIDTSAAYPSKEFFDMLAKAGSAETGVAGTTLRSAFVKCHQSALKTKSGEVEIKGAEIRCSFYRDTGQPDIMNFEVSRK